jgi:phage-related tail fiber protein
VPVVEVNGPHAHSRARRGKTDALDAEAAARKVLAGEWTTPDEDTTSIVEAIGQVQIVRVSPAQAGTAAGNQFSELHVTAGRVRAALAHDAAR